MKGALCEQRVMARHMDTDNLPLTMHVDMRVGMPMHHVAMYVDTYVVICERVLPCTLICTLT